MPIAAIALCLLQARSTLVEPRPRPRTGKHIGHPDLHPPLSSVQDPRTTRDDVENGRETEIETFARPPEQTPVRSETRQSTHGTLHSTAVHARCPSSCHSQHLRNAHAARAPLHHRGPAPASQQTEPRAPSGLSSRASPPGQIGFHWQCGTSSHHCCSRPLFLADPAIASPGTYGAQLHLS